MRVAVKLAANLTVGDRIVRDQPTGRMHGTVLSVVESAQIIRKPVVIVTVQREGGRPTHLTYSKNSPVTVEVVFEGPDPDSPVLGGTH
jgi:hypothetical protein